MGRSRASIWMEHMKDQDQFIRSKFNGTIVMNVTGLKNGKDLGAFMAHLKQTVFTHYDLFCKSQDEINIEINREYLSERWMTWFNSQHVAAKNMAA